MPRSIDIMPSGSLHAQAKRRSKLVLLMTMHPDMPNTRLARKFNVSDRTIAEDRKAIQDMGFEWGNEQAQGGFMYECSRQLARMEKVISNMERDYDIDRKKGLDATNLGSRMAKLAALKLEIMDNVPMYHKFSQYAKRLEASQAI